VYNQVKEREREREREREEEQRKSAYLPEGALRYTIIT